jgi:tetratricopeptide (TPR) repeat protein
MEIYAPGSVIAGRYEIASLPHAGGMGVVYFALDHGRGRQPVALKTFRPELLANRGAREKFLEEANAWLTLGQHPHIVELYSVDRVEGRGEVYIAAELILAEEGKLDRHGRRDASLRAWIEPGGMGLEQAIALGIQIVWGMGHAVGAHPDLVHCDLKPANVLVGRDKVEELGGVNRVRVTDFGLVAGLAKAGAVFDRASNEDVGHSVIVKGIGGTPPYMALEQWRGERLDERTDVYAWGLMMAELLSGEMQVQADSREGYRRVHLDGVRLRLPVDLLPDLKSLVAACTARNKEDRPDGWTAVEEALGAVWVQLGYDPLPVGGWTQGVEADRWRQMAALTTIGLSYDDIGRYQAAMDCYKQVLALAREKGDRVFEGAALGNLGIVYAKTGRFDEAEWAFQQNLIITQELGDREGEGKTLSNLGGVYQQIGRYREAEAVLQEHLLITDEIGDRAGEGLALGNLGNVYAYTGQFEDAEAMLREQLIIKRELGDRAGEGLFLGNLGSVYLLTDRYQEAEKMLQMHLAITRELGDRTGEGAALGSLGILYRKTGRDVEAEVLLQEQLLITREVGDFAGEEAALGNLGNVYVQTERFEEAMAAYEKCIAIAEKIGDPSRAAVSNFNLALLTAQLRRLPEALEYAKQAKAVFEQLGQLHYAAKAQAAIDQIKRARSI